MIFFAKVNLFEVSLTITVSSGEILPLHIDNQMREWDEELHLEEVAGTATDWGTGFVIGFWKPGQSVIGASGFTAVCCHVTEAEWEAKIMNEWMIEEV